MTKGEMTLKAVRHLFVHCGGLDETQSCLILCDESTSNLASLFLEEGKAISPSIKLLKIPPLSSHGEEPPGEVADQMKRVDLIVSLCRYSLAHSQARINAGLYGARFLSMPLYDLSLLLDSSIMVDYKAQSPTVKAVADRFTHGQFVHVTSSAGTDIRMKIVGRQGNFCPGFVEKPGDLGSPPDIEANISPLEYESNGRLIIDGSITCPEIGLLIEPVELFIKDGCVVNINCHNLKHQCFLERLFEERDSKRRVLAECGVGLNPLARLTGTMLTDEGAFGCVHFGFGSNHTVGGQNNVAFHLDFVIQKASLSVDDRFIMSNGDLVV